MKQIVRYRFLTIPNKMHADIRITVDESSRADVKSKFEGGESTTLVLLPMINIQLVRPLESDGNGGRFRPMGNMNDSIGLTKFNYPTFLSELKQINEDLKTPDLYVYRGDRLDLNDAVAEKVRRAFIIGRTSIEFRAVVIEQPTDISNTQRLEGIKMKFNNEDSSMLFTLRELESMIWILDHVDIDNLVLQMYNSFMRRSIYERQKPVVDIKPVSRPVYNQAEPVAYVPVETRIEEPKKVETKDVKQETVLTDIPTKYSLTEPEIIPFEDYKEPEKAEGEG